MILCFSYAEKTPDEFFKDDNGVIKEREKLDTLLRDLGMGKETSFSYPWRPDKSPNFCKNATQFIDDAYIEYNSEEGNPGKACNEFIFTRA